MTKPILLQPREIQVATLEFRADLVPGSFSDADRSFEIVFASEAPVLRRNHAILDVPFDEVLGLGEGEADLSRFEQGRAPLLDSHGMFAPRMEDTLGTTVPDSVRLFEAEGVRQAAVRVQLLEHDSMSRVEAGVRQGVFRNASAGYRVLLYREITEAEHPRPRLRAVSWEAKEVSLVPFGADALAGVRSGSNLTLFPCGLEPAHTRRTMDEELENEEQTVTTEGRSGDASPAGAGGNGDASSSSAASEGGGETDTDGAGGESAGDAGVEGRAGESSSPTDAEIDRRVNARLEAEDERRHGILEAARMSGLEDDDLTQTLLRDRRVTVEGARSRMLSRLAEQGRTGTNGGEEILSASGPSGVEVGRDRAFEGNILGVRDSILSRVNYRGEYDQQGRLVSEFEPCQLSRRMDDLGLQQLGRIVLKANGIRGVDTMPESRVGELLFGMRSGGMISTRAGGYHASGDFPSITADVSNKVLRMAYLSNRRRFTPLVRQTTVSNFKPINRPQFGEGPTMDEIPEGTAFNAKAINEEGISYVAKKYGSRFTVTWEAMLNDDTDAFGRVPTQLGSAAAREESEQFWALITGNQTMGDGNPLFDAANHANDNTGANAITIANLNAAMALMSQQVGPDGTLIEVEATTLIGPPSLRATMLQFTREVNPEQPANVNPFSDILETVIVEPRLSADSTTRWYLASSPSQIDMGEIARLRGANGPTVEFREGWEVDGMDFKVRHVFGVAILDWRGFVRGSD